MLSLSLTSVLRPATATQLPEGPTSGVGAEAVSLLSIDSPGSSGSTSTAAGTHLGRSACARSSHGLRPGGRCSHRTRPPEDDIYRRLGAAGVAPLAAQGTASDVADGVLAPTGTPRRLLALAAGVEPAGGAPPFLPSAWAQTAHIGGTRRTGPDGDWVLARPQRLRCERARRVAQSGRSPLVRVRELHRRASAVPAHRALRVAPQPAPPASPLQSTALGATRSQVRGASLFGVGSSGVTETSA